MAEEKPLVLMGATPVYGHLMPLRAVAKALVGRGYEITFVSASHYQKQFEEIGCTYVPLEGYADWHDGTMAERWPELSKLALGLEGQGVFALVECFFKSIPGQHEALQRAMKMLRDKYPTRPIVQICEGFCTGGLPISLGAPGLKPTGTMGMGVIPIMLTSIDTAIFGASLPPPTSPEERAAYQVIDQQIMQRLHSKPQQVWEEIMISLCGKSSKDFFLNAQYLFQDRYLQMSIPSAEYPRSDAPPTILFCGNLPKGSRDGMATPPPFWNEIASNASNPKPKKIIAVSQGTFSLNYEDLLVPSMTALADRDDILVVIALGKKGAVLPAGTVVPANARVADFIPYDDLLPYCDIFVTNCGYGAFQHAINNGTPILCAGEGEDKVEVTARAEWCGIGVNLKTGKPTVNALKKGVDEILGNGKYKARALELQAESESFDAISIVARNIDELGRGEKLV